MIVNGKQLAEDLAHDLAAQIAASKKKLRLGIVMVGEDSRSLAFIRQKEKFAEIIRCDTRIYKFPIHISTSKLRAEVSKIAHIPQNQGVIVQMPLPDGINEQNILNAVVPTKDIDVLSARSVGDAMVGTAKIESPIVGALQAVLAAGSLPSVSGMEVVVVGAGRLVGRPVASWLIREGANVSVLNDSVPDISIYTKRADVIVMGAGVPGLLKGGMVKDGVIVIDAGTSESEGKIVGDVDTDSVSPKAAVLAAVPGGIGPLTVAMVFKNLVTLALDRKR